MRRYCKVAPRYEDFKRPMRRAKWAAIGDLPCSGTQHKADIKQNPIHLLNDPFATD